MVMKALVLAGLPTTSTFTSLLAYCSRARPWPSKMAALACETIEGSVFCLLLVGLPSSMPYK